MTDYREARENTARWMAEEANRLIAARKKLQRAAQSVTMERTSQPPTGCGAA